MALTTSDTGRPAGQALPAPAPFFSVLVPTYNQEAYLPAALDSLLAQSFPDWEAVVINDGSTDASGEVMAAYAARDPRIRVFHKENGGVSSALNEGLRRARGEWLCWLSSDDLFEPDKLAVHRRAIAAHPEIRVFHTSYSQLFEESGAKTAEDETANRNLPPLELQTVTFCGVNYYNGISIAIHRSVFEKVGPFNEGYRFAQDAEMWLRISALFPSRFLPERTCVSRVHPAQGTSLFYDAGYFESARSGLEFLNSHPYEALFPLLDLGNPDHALYAAANTLLIAVTPKAYLNLCGFMPALIERLHEWLAGKATPAVRERLKPLILDTVATLADAGVPTEVIAACRALPDAFRAPFSYVPRDPLAGIERHAELLASRGETEKAASLRRYADRASGAGKPAATAAAEERDPSVSILIPCFNHAPYLGDTLKSLISQSFADWEAIVVDDASTAGDPAAVAADLADPRIRVVRHGRNRGPAAAKNTGYRLARGELLLPLDADDLLHPEFLATCVALLKARPETDCVFADLELFGAETGVWRYGVKDARALTTCQWLPGAGALMRRTVWERAGGYWEERELCPGNEDWDFWLSAMEKGLSPAHIPEPLYRYRRHSGDVSLSVSLRHDDYRTRVFIYGRHRELFDRFGTGPSFLEAGYLTSARAAWERGEELVSACLAALGWNQARQNVGLAADIDAALAGGKYPDLLGIFRSELTARPTDRDLWLPFGYLVHRLLTGPQAAQEGLEHALADPKPLATVRAELGLAGAPAAEAATGYAAEKSAKLAALREHTTEIGRWQELADWALRHDDRETARAAFEGVLALDPAAPGAESFLDATPG